MSDIATKLEYLNGTKQKLKQAINNLGGDITSQTTFRNYATELDTLYSNLPKVEGEGSSITLSPTLKGKLNYENNIVGYGDTEQETTQGYNIFDGKTLLPATITRAGVTFTNNGDGTFNVSGTATANTNFTIIITSLFTTGHKYGIYCSTPYDNPNFNYTLQYGGSTIKYIAPDTGTFEYTSEYNTVKLSLWIDSGVTVNATNVKTMIYEGDSKITTYEPYTNGASPNPTYPQEIEVVTGTQEVKVENVNLLKFTQGKTATSSGLTATCNDNSTITINGTSNGMVAMAFNIDTKPLNGNYTLSGYTRNDTYLQLYTKNSSGTIRVTNMKSTPTISFSNETLFQVFIFVANGTTATFNNETFNLQLEKGSQATTYVEHQEQTQTISLGDIELCKIGNYQDYLEYDVDNDKVYKNKAINKYQFTGNENFGKAGSTNLNGYIFNFPSVTTNILPPANNGTKANILSNAFITKAVDTIISEATYGIGIRSDKYLYIGAPLGSFENASALQTYLANNITFMYYALQTEVKEEITGTLKDQIKDIYNLMSYNGTTNIEVVGNLPMIMKIRALKGE